MILLLRNAGNPALLQVLLGRSGDERRRLPGLGIEAAALSYERMRHNAATLGGGWARMWDNGVGGIIRRRGLRLEANAGRLLAALME